MFLGFEKVYAIGEAEAELGIETAESFRSGDGMNITIGETEYHFVVSNHFGRGNSWSLLYTTPVHHEEVAWWDMDEADECEE